jgi:hypothetical protein
MKEIHFTRKHAFEVLSWYEKTGCLNWSNWKTYPNLPVKASFVSYESNHCQINLEAEIRVRNKYYNCISTEQNPVGEQWNKPLTFTQLQNMFSIYCPQILRDIVDQHRKDEIKVIEKRIKSLSNLLALGDDQAPSIIPIEKVFLRHERSTDNFVESIGPVTFKNSSVVLRFQDEVEWTLIRELRSRTYFTPVSIPHSVQQSISTTLQTLHQVHSECLLNEYMRLHQQLHDLKSKTFRKRRRGITTKPDSFALGIMPDKTPLY